jgi:hypothetical protein
MPKPKKEGSRMRKLVIARARVSHDQIISQEEMYEELCWMAEHAVGKRSRARLQALADDFAPATPKPVKKRAARKTTKKVGSKTPTLNAVIREWAAENGYHVGIRGKIPNDVVAAYNEATTHSTQPQTEVVVPTVVGAVDVPPSEPASVEEALSGISEAVRQVAAPADHLAPKRDYPAKKSGKQRQRTS